MTCCSMAVSCCIYTVLRTEPEYWTCLKAQAVTVKKVSLLEMQTKAVLLHRWTISACACINVKARCKWKSSTYIKSMRLCKYQHTVCLQTEAVSCQCQTEFFIFSGLWAIFDKLPLVSSASQCGWDSWKYLHSYFTKKLPAFFHYMKENSVWRWTWRLRTCFKPIITQNRKLASEFCHCVCILTASFLTLSFQVPSTRKQQL